MNDFWYHNHSISAPISLSQCGYESYQPSSTIRNYTVHQKWIIHYVLSGKGYLEVDNQYFELKKDNIFFFFQGQKVRYYSDKLEPWTLIWIGIQGEEITDLLEETTLLNKNTADLANNGTNNSLKK